MEKPTIDPTTGEPQWQPDGARQRFAEQLAEEVDFGRLYAAAAQVLHHRMVQRGEIGPDDETRPSKEDVMNVIQWSDLRQLRLLKKIAEGLIEDKVAVH
jgi:hypothetical protein